MGTRRHEAADWVRCHSHCPLEICTPLSSHWADTTHCTRATVPVQ
jgi:hypothetical protein